MAITLRITGLTEAVGTLQRLPKELEKRTILRMSQVAYDEAFIGAQRHSKTGALVQSLYNRATPNGSGRAVGHDTERAPQALWVNLGTKAHVIRPNKKKALRWAAGNRFAFAKKVNHPGYRGDAYLIASATKAVQEFAAAVNAAFKEST